MTALDSHLTCSQAVVKQVFPVTTTRSTPTPPKTALFLCEKPGRIEPLYEYPTLEVFRYMLVGYMRVNFNPLQ